MNTTTLTTRTAGGVGDLVARVRSVLPSLTARPAPPAVAAPQAPPVEAWTRGRRIGVAALLLGTLCFWLYGLDANGYANSFYSAAVQAGSESWKAFFYGSSDAANSITVDKPPASLWLMALSVRLFGLNSWAILVPEVLMGVATVGLLYASVRRVAGHSAGMLAGLVLALTPVATLMFRFDNPDALLALLLTAAAAATIRAVEKADPRWLVGAGVLLGFGFLTKTLQAFLILPVLGLVYLVAAPTTLRRRLLHGAAALAAMVVAGGWWVAIVELVPASLRPYIGGSQTNSFLELTFGYNGLGRISGDEEGSVGPNMGTASIWRMFSASVGGQISWLLPSALLLLVVGLWLTRRAPRTDLRRAAYLVWGGSMVVTGVVFSLMAGIFHEYYTVALAPYIAAVVGIGAVEAWRRGTDTTRERWGSVALSAAVAAASTWSFVLLTRSASYGPLRYGVLIVGMSAALLLLVTTRLHRSAVPVVAVAALLASLAGPAAYSVSTVSHGHSGSIVTAGPTAGTRGPGGGMGGGMGAPPAAPAQNGAAAGTGNGLANGAANGTTNGAPGGTSNAPAQTGGSTGAAASGAGGSVTARAGNGGPGGGMGSLLDASTPDAEVVAALRADSGSYTWAAAAVGSQSAAGLQLGSGEPVMAIGGFNGSDPSPTLAQFQRYVSEGRIHYFVAGGRMGMRNGGSDAASQITAWVSANFTQVTIGSSTFYDLTRPVSAS